MSFSRAAAIVDPRFTSGTLSSTSSTLPSGASAASASAVAPVTVGSRGGFYPAGVGFAPAPSLVSTAPGSAVLKSTGNTAEWLALDEKIQKMISDIVTSSPDYNDVKVEDMSTTFAFTGLDLIQIMKDFYSYGAAYYTTRGMSDFINQIKIDLVTILQAIIVRGPGITRARLLETMSEEGRQKLLTLFQIYRVSTEGQFSKRVITLGRLQAANAIYIATASVKMSGAREVGRKPHHGYPKFMMYPSFASLIPTDCKVALGAFLDWTSDFTAVTNRQRPKDDRDVMVISSRQYARNVSQTNYYKDASKWNTITACLRVLNDDKKIPPSDYPMIVAMFPVDAVANIFGKKGRATVETKRLTEFKSYMTGSTPSALVLSYLNELSDEEIVLIRNWIASVDQIEPTVAVGTVPTRGADYSIFLGR